MGKKHWILAILTLMVILSFTANSYALRNYDKTKGDFKIFFMGDNKTSVIKKLTYLAEKGEISGVTGAEQFQGEALSEKVICSFRYAKALFGQEKIREIRIDFYEHQAAPGQFEVESKEFARYLQVMLEKNYGTPSYRAPYLFLSQIKENKDKYLVKWEFFTKIVGIAFTRNPDAIFTQIIISDPLHPKAEIQEFN